MSISCCWRQWAPRWVHPLLPHPCAGWWHGMTVWDERGSSSGGWAKPSSWHRAHSRGVSGLRAYVWIGRSCLHAGPAGPPVHPARARLCQKHRRHHSSALTFANGATPRRSLLAFHSRSHGMTFSAAPCQRLPLPITHGCSAPQPLLARRWHGRSFFPGKVAAGQEGHDARVPHPAAPGTLGDPAVLPQARLPCPGLLETLGFAASLLTCSRAVPARS